MAFYQGKEVQSRLIDTLVEKLTTPPAGSVEPYWTRVESGGYQNEGFILFSNGKSGVDRIFIRMKQTAINGIEFSIIEDYQPNPVQGLSGIVTNEGPKQNCYFASSSVYGSNQPVHYWLSFDKDKIMLALKGDKVLSNAVKSFVWIGAPQRFYDPAQEQTTPLAHANSRWSSPLVNTKDSDDLLLGYCRGLRDRARNTNVFYTMTTLTKWKSKGWGDTILLGEIFLHHNAAEGFRGKMDGVYALNNSNPPDFQDGDEIMVGSKRYTVHNIWSAGSRSNCWNTPWLAVEQIQ